METLRSFWRDCQAVVNKSWWWQQGWTILTDTLLSFLAIFGFSQHLSLNYIFLGMALVFAFSWLTCIFSFQANRKQLLILGGVVMTLAVLSFLTHNTIQWWLLTASVGILLGFRDAQNIKLFAWIPLRARRRKRNPSQALKVGQILTFVLTSFGLLLSAVLMKHTNYLPQVIIFIGVFILVPHMILNTNVNTPKTSIDEIKVKSSSNKHLQWMIKVASLYNGAHFLGRRLLLPLAFAMISQQWGLGKNVFVFFGLALTFVALIALLVPKKNERVSHAMMKKGLEACILGWLIVVVGFLLLPLTISTPLSLVIIIVGWVIVELSVRAWGVGYMDTLRLMSTVGNTQHSRAYKEALVVMMANKNRGAMGAMLIAGWATIAYAPLIVGVLGVGCWQTYRLGRHHLKVLS